jgi:autotransporter-associated beta strand protein
MNTPVAAALRFSLIFLVSAVAYADNAQWNLNPTSDNWNIADNWMPMTVPNGPEDIATFSLSNTTNVSISEDTEVNGIIFTSAATNPYSITVSSGLTLTLSGTGFTNNSGIAQFLYCGGFGGDGGEILLSNSASAGNASITSYGLLQFSNSSTAGSADIENGGDILFSIGATASSAKILNFSLGEMEFSDSSTAGNATINGYDTSFIEFFDTSTAGSATINSLGEITFYDSSEGSTARIWIHELVPVPESGILDISRHNTPGVTIGSIEGDGYVFLGSNNLTIGSNNLSTTFSGFIEDNGSGGSLTKIGNGMLVLDGENTYSGGTAIKGGKLVINNTTGSGTGSGPVEVSAGQLGGGGIIGGDVTVGDGSRRRGALSPGDSVNGYDTLTIQSTLTFQSEAIYKFNLKSSTAESDSVVANGVTINSAALFDFTGVGHRRLPIGTIFRVIDNISANPIAGTFSNLPDQSTFIIKGNKYQVSYQGGDGNDLTLTVVP